MRILLLIISIVFFTPDALWAQILPYYDLNMYDTSQLKHIISVTHRWSMDYGTGVSVTTFNEDGNPERVHNEGRTTETVFTYTSNHLLHECASYDKGRLVTTIINTYDSNNHLILQAEYGISDSNDQRYLREHSTIDYYPSGAIKKKLQYEFLDTSFPTLILSYDSLGRLIQKITHPSPWGCYKIPEHSYTTTNSWNSDNSEMIETTIKENETVPETILRHHYLAKKQIKCTSITRYGDAKPIKNTDKWKYDSLGRLIEYKAGVSLTRIEYNDMGLPVQTIQTWGKGNKFGPPTVRQFSYVVRK